MQKPTLVIADKIRSSWSLRPWLFLKHHGVDFDEVRVALEQPDTRSRILEHSPSGRLPCLKLGSLRVWESLAICEFAAETYALPLAWPMDPAARALARSMAAEMHAGFAELRRELPFDALRAPAAQAYGERTAADIARIRGMWREARSQHGRGGAWLFGKFGIVDAMYAPVALRFHAYEVPLDGAEREYVFNVLMHPAVQAWLDQAELERPASAEPESQAESTAEHTAEVLQAEPPAAASVAELREVIAETVQAAVIAAAVPMQHSVAMPPVSAASPPHAARYVDDPSELSLPEGSVETAEVRPAEATADVAGAESNPSDKDKGQLKSFILPP